MVDRQTAAGGVNNPVGLMRRALDESYLPAPEPAEKRETPEKTSAAREAVQQLKAEAARLRLQEEQLAATAIDRFLTLSAAGQQAIIDELAAANPFFCARYARQGREGLLKGILRMILAHHLEEKWSLRLQGG